MPPFRTEVDVKYYERESVVAELNHQINSPLAAIRNALFLASCRCSDPEVIRYLGLAEREAANIAQTLRKARRDWEKPTLRSVGRAA